MVQFSAAVDRSRVELNYSKMNPHSTLSGSTSGKSFTPQISKKSLKILKNTGFDFNKPYVKRFFESNRAKENYLAKKREEHELNMKKVRVPIISSKSRSMVGDRNINIFKKL